MPLHTEAGTTPLDTGSGSQELAAPAGAVERLAAAHKAQDQIVQHVVESLPPNTPVEVVGYDIDRAFADFTEEAMTVPGHDKGFAVETAVVTLADDLAGELPGDGGQIAKELATIPPDLLQVPLQDLGETGAREVVSAIDATSDGSVTQEELYRVVKERKIQEVFNSIDTEKDRGESNVEFTLRVRDSMHNILTYMDLPGSVIADFERAIDVRSMVRDETGRAKVGKEASVSGSYIRDAMQKVLRLRELPPDVIERVWDRAGLSNLDYYNADIVSRMSRFLEYDQQFLESLREGDVTAVMVDATGDHNGANSIITDVFEKPSGRTLYFEVHKPADIYRYMSLMRVRGIKPSTLVFAAHGSPKGMILGERNGDDAFVLTNRTDKPDIVDYEASAALNHRTLPEVPVAAANGLTRFVQDYMQDSRGIDDPASDEGRRKIILKSCRLALPTPVERTTSSGFTVRRDESFAETVARKAGRDTVDVIASPENANMVRVGSGYELRSGSRHIQAHKVRILADSSTEVVPVDRVDLHSPHRKTLEELEEDLVF